MRIAGFAGSIRIGGRQAAVFQRWEMEYSATGWQLTATARQADAYWLGQPGLFDIRLEMGRRTYRLKNAAVSVAGEQISASGNSKLEEM